jgi:hypothetical protein
MQHLMGFDGIQIFGGLLCLILAVQAIRLFFSILSAMTTFRR